MNILHYSLGFPPFRRGGMTQYCIDLMVEQIKSGHDVGLLWPGVLRDLSEKSKLINGLSMRYRMGYIAIVMRL